MADRLSINQWAEEDRPREKLMRLGAEALSNAELLAILIGSGTPQKSAVQLMQEVLADCKNNLNTLGKWPLHRLTGYKGMGPAKAVTIMAACELGRRRAATPADKPEALNSPEAIFRYISTKIQDKDVEEAWVVLLNQAYRLIKPVKISHGGITDTSVDVRIIMREALLAGATVLALSHNHPSGNPLPSRDDDRLTQRVKSACETMRIHFLDHVIVADGAYYSYADEGKI